jgi:hypothetical protein
MAVSAKAAVILEQMEPGCSYEAKELRAFVPDLTLEQLRDLMRELWVARQVERAGYSGWRRQRSASPATEATRSVTHRPAPAGIRHTPIKPEDLFDHDAFEDMFK